MPLTPLKARLIYVHKYFGNLEMTDFISVSMVMVNNWFLPVKRHEHQDRKCRDPKSNALIMGFYQCVLFWSNRGNLHPLKSMKKRCLLSQTLCTTFLRCQVATHSLCDVTESGSNVSDVIQAVGGNLVAQKRHAQRLAQHTTCENTGGHRASL